MKFNLDADEKENQYNLDNINRNLSQAQDLVKVAHDEMFNFKYKDYKSRIEEVNKAKLVLLANRDKMTVETKKRMVKHIKRKMMIIEMMEEEFHDMSITK